MANKENLYLYIKSPVDGGDNKFVVHNIEGTEIISGLFEYMVTLGSGESSISSDNIIGKHATVTIETYNKQKRYIDGIVTRFIKTRGDVHTTYLLELRPWFWELTLMSDNRIYQQKTSVDIIKDIFKEKGYTDFSDKTTNAYTERVYCVQYRETTFDFISRLMEEDGIYYYFEHTDGKHNMVLTDNKDTHQPCPGFSDAKMQITSLSNDERILSVLVEEKMTTNQYKVNDYNFETPSTSLVSTAKDGTGTYSIYEYPVESKIVKESEFISKIRLDACLWNKKIIKGESIVRSFTAGYKFKLTQHPIKDLNAEYIIYKLNISVNQDGYTNTFEAFPSSVQYRSSQVTPKPRIYGSQTALVVGKSGEEIWTDKYGRIKVQFYWDQYGKFDETSSCWIRVAQIWGGKSWGSLFTPRMGMEVIINFFDGDPDNPIITGCVYNASQTLPYTLPTDQNKSTILSRSTKDGSAGNEMRFDDSKDKEEFYLHAQKDMNVLIENLRTTTIKESDDTLTIQKGNLTTKVEKGKEVHEVKDTRDVTVTGNETHTDKANFTHKVSGNYTLNVDGNLTIKVGGSVEIKAGTSFANKAGTSYSSEAGTDYTAKAGTTYSASAGISMECKASATMKLDGGGMLEAKGGIIKLN